MFWYKKQFGFLPVRAAAEVYSGNVVLHWISVLHEEDRPKQDNVLVEEILMNSLMVHVSFQAF